MHWGFETSNMYTCLRRVTNSRDTAPYQTSRSQTWDSTISGPEQHDFLITILFSMFSRSDIGAWWWGFFSPHPSMLVWKGLGNLETVLYFGLISFVVVFTVSRCPRKNDQYHTVQVWERLPTVPSGRLKRGSPPLSLWKEELYSTCGFPGTLLFSGALATAAAIFISFSQTRKTV